jgi:hypothetical protein
MYSEFEIKILNKYLEFISTPLFPSKQSLEVTSMRKVG